MSIENVEKVAEATNISAGIRTLISEIDRFPIDRKSIPQNKLDLVSRSRKSLFPWRGQFSPELIELLLTYYASPRATVLDPFVGSGTALFEAARKSLVCFGVEINPAAVEMANAVRFVNTGAPKRLEYIRRAKAIMEKYQRVRYERNLFSFQERTGKPRPQSSREAFRDILVEASAEPEVHNIIVNTFLRYATLRDKKKPNALLRAFRKHKDIIEKLPYSERPCKVFQCDARSLPLENGSVDLVITSPPYINVFNYHQNYREIMEMVGWDLLNVAKSEIGSNRKNRGNRFLTVTQYSIDMLQALCEMRRVIRPDGRIIIVIGRESRVRDVSFENYRIISALAVGGAALRLICRQERRFVNRFGKTIREDLLHLVPAREMLPASDDFARTTAVYFLREALNRAPDNVRGDIVSAIERAHTVPASPYFAEPECCYEALGLTE